MNTEKGNVSINAENMMPIIKKWLYSDRDIFIREQIANCCDAMTKHQKLAAMGEAEPRDDYKVVVTIDHDAGTLTFTDNGIGMTDEEVRTYINQVAFSGAKDFMAKYEQSGDDSAIIGHFGLGFYSAFMVADKVTINTKSYISSAEPVKWESDDGSEYQISLGDRTEQGTDVILHMDAENDEFLHLHMVRETIEKYCAFLPFPIYLFDVDEEKRKVAERAQKAEDDARKAAEDAEKAEQHAENVEAGNDSEEPEEAAAEAEEEPMQPARDDSPKPLNDTHPLWMKKPSDCTEDEYKAFYKKVFKTYEDPLFWIHLNVDYPFNLKGILFFPRLNNRFETIEGQIKLFNNQVFVADNIKEVIPEFLMLLRGVIDCPDLPLNVSRSFLQNDGTVKKMQTHITKKVADKLKGLFESDRPAYEKDWKDINPFIKYGAIKDEKFYDQVKGVLLFEKLDGAFALLEEVKEAAKSNGGKAYYVNDQHAQACYMDMYKDAGQTAYILDGAIDPHFINFIEFKNEGLQFARIDSEVAQSVKGEYDGMPDAEKLQTLVRKATGEEELKVEVAPIKTELPAMFVLDENMRRFVEMSKLYGEDMPVKPECKLVLNGSSPIVKKLENAEGEKAEAIAAYLYDVAMLGRGQLTAAEVKIALQHSVEMLNMIEL